MSGLPEPPRSLPENKVKWGHIVQTRSNLVKQDQTGPTGSNRGKQGQTGPNLDQGYQTWPKAVKHGQMRAMESNFSDPMQTGPYFGGKIKQKWVKPRKTGKLRLNVANYGWMGSIPYFSYLKVPGFNFRALNCCLTLKLCVCFQKYILTSQKKKKMVQISKSQWYFEIWKFFGFEILSRLDSRKRP